MSCWKVFIFFLSVRILSVFVIKTWYVPDEYWQCLEVAHKISFGFGHLTWEWTNGIRSYFHPMIIAICYNILSYLKLDELHLLVIVPRILQALLTAFSDYRFYKWCNGSKWSIFIISTSWFIFYTGSRTLANSVEASLTTIALSFFPWQSEETSFLWPVGLACFIRPTAVIPWIPLCLYHMKKSKYNVFEILIKRYLPIGLLLGLVTFGIDSYGHGSPIFTPWEFLKVNIFEGIGSFYGVHEWHWYFIIGLPTILGITTIPFLLATVEAFRNKQALPTQNVLLLSILLTLIMYSLLPHKEFRFILSILPMCFYICSDYLTRWSRKASNFPLWLVAIALLIGNLVPASYLSFVHQKGTIEVMPHLAKIAREYKDENGGHAKIFFLMPCHSTPYYSHIHHNVTLRFLTCEPNLKKVNNYVDEAEDFYKNPMVWIHANLPVYPHSALPTHLVMFDNLIPSIEEFLVIYKPIHTILHADVASDRVGKNVIVYERTDKNEKTETESKTKKRRNEELIDDEEII